MLNYEVLSDKTEELVKSGKPSDYRAENKNVIRRIDSEHDRENAWRTSYVRDADKIMNCPFYNRYADKTQVFSLYKNDDITRRAQHVQFVSRTARTIGGALGLNLDLIEAIALGHDIGHTPFGHAGEKFLDELYFASAGRHFAHNIHSVRVLDGIYPYNISLQTLSGIASHDGELELSEYRPKPLNSFEEFDKEIEACYLDKDNIKRLVPSTLEGCVVRISDIIAYLGKDRQDARLAGLITEDKFTDVAIGKINAEIVNNLIVNIIENSYGKSYIRMDAEHFDALKTAKTENYKLIYEDKRVGEELKAIVRPMMADIYGQLLDDLKNKRETSPIFTHHIDYVTSAHYKREVPYENSLPDQIVVDYIASMTDDYFVDLYKYLFPNTEIKLMYKGYFD